MDALENLDVWKRSCRLCVSLYRCVSRCQNWAFKDQITRSALSVPSNIAEGYERDSKREFVRFLRIAKGSCGEFRTQLYIGMEAGFVDKRSGMEFATELLELSKMLNGLIRHYQR